MVTGPTRRKINGKWYKLLGRTNKTRKEALRDAKALRGDGVNARVVKHVGGYGVYYRFKWDN